MPRTLSRHSALPIPTPEDRARDRADEIRAALTDTVEAYAQAVRERDWETLGYDSVADWREAEFGQLRFSTEARRQLTELLPGQTVRELENVTGASHATVIRDRKLVVSPDATSASPRQQAARQREEAKRSPQLVVSPDTTSALDSTKAEVKKAAERLRDLGKPRKETKDQKIARLEARVAELEELVAKYEAG